MVSRVNRFPFGDTERKQSLVSLTLCAAVHWGDGIWFIFWIRLFRRWRFVHGAAAGRIVCIVQLSEIGVKLKIYSSEHLCAVSEVQNMDKGLDADSIEKRGICGETCWNTLSRTSNLND